MPPSGPSKRDARIVRNLCTWFDHAMRDLPWRRSGPPGRRDPYHSLLSELMLQQTQVARVIDKFNLFLQRFPTLAHLAAAPLDEVLALWSGLGYYRRARLLHAAAQSIITDHAGIVPRDITTLRTIPGIGPYTAGAIASIAHGQRTPLVDGNVVRVLLRVEGRGGAADEKATIDWTWKRAATLVAQADRPGAFNEALMELGATVCTPKSPACGECPLRELCRARALGKQAEIPRPKARAARQHATQTCVIVHDARGRILMEERGPKGLWAGLWRVLTLEAHGPKAVAKALLDLGINGNVRRVGKFTFHTSHREVEFVVWKCEEHAHGAAARKSLHIDSGAVVRRRWVAPPDIPKMAISNADKRVLRLAGVIE